VADGVARSDNVKTERVALVAPILTPGNTNNAKFKTYILLYVNKLRGISRGETDLGCRGRGHGILCRDLFARSVVSTSGVEPVSERVDDGMGLIDAASGLAHVEFRLAGVGRRC
jgi:hypothetical protein